MSIFNLTFESANRLQWSNDYLDFIVATILFLNTFQERVETENFRTKKAELEANCLESAHDLPRLAEQLQRTLGLRTLGSSREATKFSMTSFLAALWPAVMITVIRGYTNPICRKFIASEAVKQVFVGFCKYREDI